MYGTLSSLDSLASIQQSVVEYGEQRLWDSIAVVLAAQNRFVDDMEGTLFEKTTSSRNSYGAGDFKVMEVLDQHGAPSAQKITAGITLDFPLRKYGNALQWTRTAFEQMEVAQMAAEVNAIMSADTANIIRAAKVALFGAANYSFVDYLGKPAGVTLAVKALINNDGSALPVGPNGEVFATSHNHYTAEASLTAGGLTNAVVTVQEHYNTGIPIIVISSTNEAAVRALSGFVAAADVRVIQAPGSTTAQIAAPLNLSNIYDRQIGLFAGAEVWIKPWAIASYALVYMLGGGAPPLGMRLPTFSAGGTLRLVAEDERYPLRARTYERQFGMGVWRRTGASVHYFAGGAYVAPVIA